MNKFRKTAQLTKNSGNFSVQIKGRRETEIFMKKNVKKLLFFSINKSN